MDTNILVTVSALSDQDLLARLETFAGKEREASAELVAHLAALDCRPALYAAEGYGSLFTYCTEALRLSEDAACNRIVAARACRRFPLILELLASGSLSLTSVRLLSRHLTTENHESALAKARDRTRREIEALVAELAPRPDIPSTVRKIACVTKPVLPLPAAGLVEPPGLGHAPSSGPDPEIVPSLSVLPATPRPIVQALAPGRYRVQFTVGQETHDKLRRLQALLRREIPNGDPGVIFDAALTVLLDKVEKTKLAAVAKPRGNRPIRPGTDKDICKPGLSSRHVPPALAIRTVPPALPSRILPRAVKRSVWEFDLSGAGSGKPLSRLTAPPGRH